VMPHHHFRCRECPPAARRRARQRRGHPPRARVQGPELPRPARGPLPPLRHSRAGVLRRASTPCDTSRQPPPGGRDALDAWGASDWSRAREPGLRDVLHAGRPGGEHWPPAQYRRADQRTANTA
jgi:hypothetical protein